MLERDFQKKVVEYLKGRDCYFFKVIVSNKKGTPDLVGCYNGFFFGIECKARNGKISTLQLKAHENIQEQGGRCLVLFENENFKQVLDSWFDKEF